MFLRQLQHLLPNATAWRLFRKSTLRKFLEGLVASNSDVRDFADGVFDDLFPDTTRELAAWEKQFGVQAAASESDRRAALLGEWHATGGQSPRYLQDVVQAAGFPLFIHEWWDPAAPAFQQAQCGEPGTQCGESRAQASDKSFPRFVRNPLLYTSAPLIGTVQCGEPLAECGEAQAQSNRVVVNGPGYLVNLSLTDDAPPPIPNDEDAFHYFLYWGAEAFPNRAQVPAERRAELERLVLKLCPAQQWLVMLVDYV